MNKKENVFIPSLGVVKTDNFSQIYPEINHEILHNMKSQPSRDGMVKEMLDFKMQLTNPYKRCVGGYRRNINVFFLIAEAMWIATGRKDVKFLSIFNSKMKNYSDDGINFHAPYGYRLRHWDVRTEDKFIEDNLGASKGYDQVIDAIKILSENPNSRQVVMSIWNPMFDLGYKTKDIPCNDIVMLKIRDGKLITTISNRSNDLHLGLPTNIFQFSFLTELIASSLGISLGTQTHNSQSLHIYDWNKNAEIMDNIFLNEDKIDNIGDMYTTCNVVERKMDFNFVHSVPVNRFREIEFCLNLIIEDITKISNGEDFNTEDEKIISNFSNWLYDVYNLLKEFVLYKKNLSTAVSDEEKKQVRMDALSEIIHLNWIIQGRENNTDLYWDVITLAHNWFNVRLNYNDSFFGRL